MRLKQRVNICSEIFRNSLREVLLAFIAKFFGQTSPFGVELEEAVLHELPAA